MLRKLGSLERGLTRSDLYATFNIVSVARISGPLQAEALRIALDQLQRQHALLNVRIEIGGDRFRFAAANDTKIPLETVPRKGDDHWISVVESELARPIAVNTGPLLRCLFLPPGESGYGEILLTYHHVLMDGMASIVFWRELLQKCVLPIPAQSIVDAATGPVPPTVEELLPAGYRGWRGNWRLLRYGLAQFWDEAAYALRMTGRPRPRVHAGVSNRILSLTLEPPLLESLAFRCRQNGITLNSALNAAMLLALNRKFYGGQSLLMRTFTFADLRPSLPQPIPADQLGVYFALMRYTVPVRGSMDYWALAQRVHGRIYRSLKSGDKFCAPRVSDVLVRLLTGSRLMRWGNTALSYGGVTALPTNFGDLQLQELHAFISGFDLSPELGANAILFADRLIWDMVYLDKDMTADKAGEVVDEIRGILTNAVT